MILENFREFREFNLEKEIYCCVFSIGKCWIIVTENRYFSYDSDKLVIVRYLAKYDQYFVHFSYFAVISLA